MQDGKSASEWLNKVTQDQNIEKLTDAELPTLTSIRRWFRSQIIQPLYALGHYNVGEGRFRLGDKIYNNRLVILKGTDGAASQTFTFTYDVIVYLVAAVNDRAERFRITIGDGVSTIPIDMQGNTAAASYGVSLLPGGIMTGAGVSSGAIPAPFPLPAGWSIVITPNNFVAADATEYWIVYARM